MDSSVREYAKAFYTNNKATAHYELQDWSRRNLVDLKPEDKHKYSATTYAELLILSVLREQGEDGICIVPSQTEGYVAVHTDLSVKEIKFARWVRRTAQRIEEHLSYISDDVIAKVCAKMLHNYQVAVLDLTGDDIIKAYELASIASCMTGCACNYTKIYMDNPEVFSLAVVVPLALKDATVEEQARNMLARSLIVKTEAGNTISRIYCRNGFSELYEKLINEKFNIVSNPASTVEVRDTYAVYPYMDSYKYLIYSDKEGYVILSDHEVKEAFALAHTQNGDLCFRCENCGEFAEDYNEDYGCCEHCAACCDICGDRSTNTTEVNDHRYGHITVCENCLVRNYEECSHCGTYSDSYSCTADGDTICEDCMEDYFTCEECEEIYHIDDYHEHKSRSLCETCYEEALEAEEAEEATV